MHCVKLSGYSGRVHYRIGREQHTASRGVAFIIPPHTAHVREAKSACSLYAFHLMIKDTNTDSVAVRTCIPAAASLTACDDVMAEIDSKKPQWETVARHTLIAALVRVCRDAMIAPAAQPRKKNVDVAFITAIRQINDSRTIYSRRNYSSRIQTLSQARMPPYVPLHTALASTMQDILHASSGRSSGLRRRRYSRSIIEGKACRTGAPCRYTIAPEQDRTASPIALTDSHGRTLPQRWGFVF